MMLRTTLLSLALLAAFAPARAQSMADMQRAVEQAMQAAAQANKAAADAQRSADEAIRALNQMKAAAAQPVPMKAADAAAGEGSGGLTLTRGADSVTVYGLIDVTLSNVNHLNAAGESRTSYHPSPWFSGSRWGLAGKRELGNGLRVLFRLESEFVTNTGEEDAAGILFGRDAWAGFESDTYGKFSFGRQNAVGRDFAAIYLDPYGQAKASTAEGGGTNTNNFKQMIFYAGSATGTRYDRGAVWKKAFDSGLVAGLGYQFGGVVGSASTNSTQTAALAYNGGAFNVAASPTLPMSTSSSTRRTRWVATSPSASCASMRATSTTPPNRGRRARCPSAATTPIRCRPILRRQAASTSRLAIRS